MAVFALLMLLLALACFALAAFNVATWKLIAAGLFLVTLIPFIQALKKVL